MRDVEKCEDCRLDALLSTPAQIRVGEHSVLGAAGADEGFALGAAAARLFATLL